jgi:outer membrane immunogenic protein
MKRTLLLASMAALLATSANAADIARRMPTKAVPYVNAYNWTGFYAGLNAGYGWTRQSPRADGFVGGGQIGYNWQGIGSPLVLGIEADIQGADQGSSFAVAGGTATTRLNALGTVRGRIGYAWDRALLYVTGGFAYQRDRLSTSIGAVTLDNTGWDSGYAIGGGLEYAFAGPWSAAVEYLYVDVKSRSNTIGAVTTNASFDNNLVRAKVNYRF